jgi:hypothetical protein
MLDPNWGDTRPHGGSLDEAWGSAAFESVDLGTEPVETYVDAMAATRRHGDARYCCVEIPDSPEIDWFASRNCLADAGFFSRLLGSETVAAELGLDVTEDPDVSMTVETALSMDGTLAEQLVHGGSVSYGDTLDQQYGTFAKAKRLAEAFRDAVVEDRYEEVTVHRTREAWCEWFGEPHWNVTMVVVDRRYRLAWVLVATDEGPLERVEE